MNARSLQKAGDILDQLQQQLLTLKLPLASAGTEVEPILKALVAGLFTNAAKRQADGNPIPHVAAIKKLGCCGFVLLYLDVAAAANLVEC